MTRVLFVYPNRIAEGYIQGGIVILSAVLKRAGHDTYLFDTTFFETWEEKVREISEKYLEFKPVDFEKEGFKIEKVNIHEEFKKTIEKYKPDLIAATCTSSDYPFLRALLKQIKKGYKIPVIIGGPHATVSPRKTIEEDFIDMVCTGEGEEAIVELADKIQKREPVTNIKNIWVKEEGVIYKNDVRPLIQNLDSLPYPDWDLFDARHHYRPFNGKIYYFGWFEFGRGCPYSCSYCINPYIHRLYKGKGSVYRTKTVKRMIDELKFFKGKYKIEFIRFVDETFLAMPIDKIRDFAEMYTKYVNLPFIMMTRPESVTPEKAKVLGDMHHCCKHVSIGLESGSERILRDVCNRRTTQKIIIRAFRLLKEAGIGTTSYNMLGLPTETRKNIFETIESNRKAKVDIAVVNFFYPFEGTPLREFCLKKGYISNNPGIVNYALDTILNMPQISKKELKGLRKTFSLYFKLPKFLYPLIRLCEYDNIGSNALFDLLSK